MVNEYAQWMLRRRDRQYKRKCIANTVARLRAQGFRVTTAQVEFAMDFKDSHWPSGEKLDFGFRVGKFFVSETMASEHWKP